MIIANKLNPRTSGPAYLVRLFAAVGRKLCCSSGLYLVCLSRPLHFKGL